MGNENLHDAVTALNAASAALSQLPQLVEQSDAIANGFKSRGNI
jgi:hypothetical protein